MAMTGFILGLPPIGILLVLLAVWRTAPAAARPLDTTMVRQVLRGEASDFHPAEIWLDAAGGVALAFDGSQQMALLRQLGQTTAVRLLTPADLVACDLSGTGRHRQIRLRLADLGWPPLTLSADAATAEAWHRRLDDWRRTAAPPPRQAA